MLDTSTQLLWQTKTSESGLHNAANTYSWFDPTRHMANSTIAAWRDGGDCAGSACDTWHYVQAVNDAGFCGHHDWRMPNKDELFSVSDVRRASTPPTMNTVVFSECPDRPSIGPATTTVSSTTRPGPGTLSWATIAWTGKKNPSSFAWCRELRPTASGQRVIVMRKLAVSSLLLVIALVSVSAYLRLDNSGIGCADWPECYGRIGAADVAEPTVGSTYERLALEAQQPLSWATPVHRLVASILGLTVLAMALVSVRVKT